MENSELEDMEIGEMGSSDGAIRGILSLTLDEILSKTGKNFGGMSMDEFLSNLWSFEEIQNQLHSQANQSQFIPPNTGSFSIPTPLCGKTVDEIWSEIHKDQPQLLRQSPNLVRNPSHPSHGQQALGEMTLEDFLVKAGVVQESKPSNCNNMFGSNRSMVDLGLGFGMGGKLGLSSMPYHLHNAGRNVSGNCYSSYQTLTQSVGGEPSDNSSIQKCQSLTDWVDHSSKKRIIDGPLEVVVQRRQRRMIKNRESAARSRARKQAYTVELELELNQLKEENAKLKHILAECARKRKHEIMQKKKFEKRQKPTERLRTMRRIASMAW